MDGCPDHGRQAAHARLVPGPDLFEADIVGRALAEEGRLAIGPHTGDVGRDHFNDQRELPFPVTQRLQAFA